MTTSGSPALKAKGEFSTATAQLTAKDKPIKKINYEIFAYESILTDKIWQIQLF